ncbi:MAG TPA: polysaccharide pyruvyl transferase family protein [Vitreimonas sp.]|uniref:polysaccharide pyruvyl transferase family protein n=1 Tax=Vitreimonas sp. TaxID=3069702 RepID=UPI002D3B669D|nr:polysaccharide pyruvyl transferase family protein [Vitreimonas sp.]HYD88540.1 polysaccharide pyruvyl transferase family protein [Vitreimonas sp.]
MTARQKLGVLTFHRCINYGSYWQARCLVEGLGARGGEAVLLDHRSSAVDRAEWRCALRPDPLRRTCPKPYLEKVRKFLRAVSSLPLSAPFDLDDPRGVSPCETVVIGSDEVWNFKHPWYAARRLFFGDGVAARRLVAYAASFGAHPAAAGLDQAWADKLRRFDAIGVRDEHSRQIVRGALGRDPAVVLDPCLQFDSVCRRADGETSGDVLVYGHAFPDWFMSLARQWADRRNLRLVSIGYDNPWADEQWIDAGPEEFAQAMGAALAVITNFFHGCVFALLNAKPFVSLVDGYRANKIGALAAALAAERHIVWPHSPSRAFDDALDQPVRAGVIQRIGAMRETSAAYLDAALA